MGNLYITVKAVLDTLDIDYVIPPFNNQEALELGSLYAPDMACLPLKINLGNFLQAKRMGADTVLITGGRGPCRFGYYGEIHRRLLEGMGAGMDVITMDCPREGIRELIRRISRICGGLHPVKITQAILAGKNTSIAVDELEDLSFKVRARELNPGDTDRVYRWFQEAALEVRGFKEIKKLCREAEFRLRKIPVNNSFQPLRVGIVGEIYTTIEPFANVNIAAQMGRMGVEVSRPVTISSWVVDHMIKKGLRLPVDKSYEEEAQPYLKNIIGGHALETVGNALMMAKAGFDGIIQIYPLTCMPEIVAQGILKNVSKDYDIPIMTLIIDELTGEAGYMTRLEAFVDMLRRRRELETRG